MTAPANPARPAQAPQVHDDWVDTPEGRLFVRRWTPVASSDAVGQARIAPAEPQAPIVLLHDSLGCVTLWRDFPALLAQATGRTVVAYDCLGFGQSDPHPGTLPPSFVSDEAHGGFAAVKAHLQRQLGMDGFALLGHSVGGGMAVACAAAYPQACRALITESAQAFVEDRTLAGIRDAQIAFRQPGQVARLQKYHGDKAAWVLSAWIDTWLAEAFHGWTLDAQIRQVRCPTLALHGELDEFGSALHPQRIAELSAGPATWRLLPGCGHVPHREVPDEVLGEVMGVLGR